MVKWSCLMLVLCISASLVSAQEQSSTELMDRSESSVLSDTHEGPSSGRTSIEQKSTYTMDRSISILNIVAQLMGVLVALITLIIVTGGIFGIFEYGRLRKIRKQIDAYATELKSNVAETTTAKDIAVKAAEESKPIVDNLKRLYEEYDRMRKTVEVPPLREEPSGEIKAKLEEYGNRLNILEAFGLKLTGDDYFKRGVDLYYRGKFDLALEAFKEAIQLKPDYATAWYNRGCALSKLSRHDGALKAYDKAIQLKPDYADAWVNKGNALSELGRHEDALEAYDKAIQLKPYAETLVNKGNVLSKLGRHEDALEAYDKAIRLKPYYADAWYNRSCLYAIKGRKKEALSDLKRAVEMESLNKENAKRDEDFKDFWDDPEFKKIVC